MDKYGPNTEAVEEHLDKIAALTSEQFRQLQNLTADLTIDESLGKESDRFWEHMWYLAEIRQRAEALAVVYDTAWETAIDASKGLGLPFSFVTAASAACVNSTLALVMQDVLTEHEFAVLSSVWNQAMGSES